MNEYDITGRDDYHEAVEIDHGPADRRVLVRDNYGEYVGEDGTKYFENDSGRMQECICQW